MTFDEFHRKWTERVHKIPVALTEAIREHTGEVYAASKAHLQRDIYDKPINTRGSSYEYQVQRGSSKRWVFHHLLKRTDTILGKRKWPATEAQVSRLKAKGMAAKAGRGQPKWRRTGHLQAAEHWTMEGQKGVIINSMDYALPRHDLGLSPGNKRAFFGSRRKSTRIAPWRKDALADVEPKKLIIYRKHLEGALR